MSPTKYEYYLYKDINDIGAIRAINASMEKFGFPGNHFEPQFIIIGAMIFLFSNTLTEKALDYWQQKLITPIEQQQKAKVQLVKTAKMEDDIGVTEDYINFIHEKEEETGFPQLLYYKTYVYQDDKFVEVNG